jgi:hypothetical protein
LEIRSADKKIAIGTEIVFQECVAGVKADVIGTVTSLIPEVEATWGGLAEYRYMGLHLRIREGVTWRIDTDGNTSNLSAHIWAHFPPSILGRFIEWYSEAVLNVVDRDREHARCELEYLKRLIERVG